MNLDISLRYPWRTWESYFELWGEGRVYCFNLEGECFLPYEHMGLGMYPTPCPPPEEGPHFILLQGRRVAGFRSPPVLFGMRLYLHLPTSNVNEFIIPHHVADVTLAPGGGYCRLFSHADNTWLEPQIYGKARIGGPGPGFKLYSTPHQEKMARDMATPPCLT